MSLTESKHLSQLIIVARDMGQPVPYETTQPLQVALLDIDDNEPVFLKPMVTIRPNVVICTQDLLLMCLYVSYGCVCLCAPQRGGLPYQMLIVREHSPPGTVVGNITRAVDADEGSNAVVYYFIAGDAGIFTHIHMF